MLYIKTIRGNASLPEDTSRSDGRRDTNRVVEGQTQRLVRLLTTLAAIEQLVLERVAQRKERAARRVRRSVDTVGTSDAARECSCFTTHAQ